MSSIDERRAAFQRYKENVKKTGQAVLPVRDVPRHGDEPRGRLRDHRARDRLEVHDILGPLLGPKADPGTTSFVPRPDWYFYFLFYLLRIFKWPSHGDPRHGRESRRSC